MSASSLLEEPLTGTLPSENGREERQLALVVDDAALDRRLAGSIVERTTSMKAIYAADGQEALEVLAQQPVALVLTDLQMPRLDGLALVKEMRQRYPLIPVVLMTAQGSAEIAIEALQAGAASFVPKNAISTALAEALPAVLHAARVERRRQLLLNGVATFECGFELENDRTLVPLLIAHLQEYLLRMNLCDDHTRMRIGVALEEALLNGIIHGNLEVSSDLRQDGSTTYEQTIESRRQTPPYAERRLHVQVRFNRAEAIVVIRDEGPGFDPSTLPDPTDPENLCRVGGRGLLLMRTFLDDVRHNSRGNEITLTKRRSGPV